METILSGDIVNSTNVKPQVYLSILEKWIKKHSKDQQYSIYRGDSFQLVVAQPAKALSVIIELKSALKRIKTLDVKIAIGLGRIDFKNAITSKSSGTAFIRSGRALDAIENKKQNIILSSDHPLDTYMNSNLKLAGILMDSWSINSAETVYEALINPKVNQTQLGELLGIKQATASRRLERAYWTEIQELILLFEQFYKDVSHGTID
jgi:hypothetical protein